MQLGALLRAIRFFGLRDGLRAVRFTIRRDRLDRRYRTTTKKATPESHPPGNLLWVRNLSHGAELKFSNASLELIFLAPDMVRINWQPGALPVPYAIAGDAWPGDRIRVDQKEDVTKLIGSQLQIEVKPEGGISFFDSTGELLRVEAPPILTGEQWEQQFPLPAQARIFGLGERACGFNLRGGTYQLWNRDPGGSYGSGEDPLYMSIPVFMCVQPSGSYVHFYENPHRGNITFDDESHVRFDRGALRAYFIQGSPDHCLDRYSRLTGRPPLPPRWSLGYHQSRWGYRNQTEVEQIVEQFKSHDLPLSVIHLDIDHMDGYRVFTFDPDRFGSIEQAAQDFQDDGIKLVAIIDPGVKADRTYDVCVEGLTRKAFCQSPDEKNLLGVVWPGWVYFPDFTKPDTRAWWGEYYPRLLVKGVAGIWHDMNEPTTFALWGDKTLPLLTQHDFESQGGDHTSAHNIYALLMNRAGYDALQKSRPDNRPWLLSRSGFAGGQRYAWNWTGDVETSWEALRQTVATMLGVSMSGFAYTGSDIGGFSGTPDRELYLRWFQLGAFSPFFRTHSAIGTKPREPWNFDDEILDATRSLLKLRYRLLPYLYTLAWYAHRHGTPLLRPMFWNDPQNSALWDFDDQFYLGADLLIAPVLTPETDQREIYFPAGKWYDLSMDQSFEGAGTYVVPAPLTSIPVYVRGGAIVPMETSYQRLELHLYLPEEGPLQGELFTDGGDGYRDSRLDRFAGVRRVNTLKLSRQQEGSYAWPYAETTLVIHGADLASIKIDQDSRRIEGNSVKVPLFAEIELTLV